MKTINELEALGSGYETKNGWNNHSIGYKDALKDVLGLIDEEFGDLIQAGQLKARING